MNIKYYYDRHRVESRHSQNWSAEEVRYDFSGTTTYPPSSNPTFRAGVSWDGNKYVGTGGSRKLKDTSVGYAGWEYANSETSCAARKHAVIDTDPYTTRIIESRTYKKALLHRQKGVLLESDIIADDGEFPDDGIKGGYWYVKKGPVNKNPQFILSTSNNFILYEGDEITLEGMATDEDEDVITVKYKIGDSQERAITAGVGEVVFSKTLLYTNGSIKDNNTVVVQNLRDNVNYTVEVWTVDTKGGESKKETRTFNIVRNRPPILNINKVDTKIGQINSDTIVITGNTLDPDRGNVEVFRDKAGTLTEIYSGDGGVFSYTISVKDLHVGTNKLDFVAIDKYGAKTKKSILIKKSAELHQIDTGIARFNVLHPHFHQVDEFLAWIKRDVDLSLDVKLSAVKEGNNENYQNVNKYTAPISDNIVEDEVSLELSQAENLVLKIEFNKQENKYIKEITGVVEMLA